MATILPPLPALQPYVAGVWFNGGVASRGDTTQRQREHVLPRGQIHIAVRLDPTPVRLYRDVDDRTGRDVGTAVVAGMRAGYYIKDVPTAVRTIGAQLRPGASRALFGVSAASLAGRHVSLEELWGSDAARLRERLAEAGEPARQLAILQSCLVARLRTVRGLHPQIAQALAIIDGVDSHEHDREHDIGTIVRMSGLSHRRFIALFRDATGLSPKRYARVRRFGRLIGMLARDPARPWTDLALAAGYSDQPHCNREFREFAGVAPQTYRRAALASPLHLPVATS